MRRRCVGPDEVEEEEEVGLLCLEEEVGLLCPEEEVGQLCPEEEVGLLCPEDDVYPGVGEHWLAHLPHLQREGSILERLLHLT